MKEEQKAISFGPSGSLHLEAYLCFDSMEQHDPFPGTNKEGSKELDDTWPC